MPRLLLAVLVAAALASGLSAQARRGGAERLQPGQAAFGTIPGGF